MFFSVGIFVTSCTKDHAIPEPDFSGKYDVVVQTGNHDYSGPSWLPPTLFDTTYSKTINVVRTGSAFDIRIEGCYELDPYTVNSYTRTYEYKLEKKLSANGKSYWGFGGYDDVKGVWFKDGEISSVYSYQYKTGRRYTYVKGKKVN